MVQTHLHSLSYMYLTTTPICIMIKYEPVPSFFWRYSPTRAQAVSWVRYLDHTRLDTHTHTHTHGRTPLNEWSARRRDRYLHNTQQTQETDIHATGEIQTRNPSNGEAVDPCVKLRGHADRLHFTTLHYQRVVHHNTNLHYAKLSI